MVWEGGSREAPPYPDYKSQLHPVVLRVLIHPPLGDQATPDLGGPEGGSVQGGFIGGGGIADDEDGIPPFFQALKEVPVVRIGSEKILPSGEHVLFSVDDIPRAVDKGLVFCHQG